MKSYEEERFERELKTLAGQIHVPATPLRARGGVNLVATFAATAAILVVAIVVGQVLAGRRTGGPTAASGVPTVSATRNVSPTDIHVTATLVPIDKAANVRDRGPWNYLVDVSFDNVAPDGNYGFDLYPYLAGTSAAVFDFGDGFDATGHVIGGAGITSGSNGARLAAAADALRAATPPIALPGGWQTEGVSFTGNRGPLRVRFAVTLPPTAFPLNPDQYRLVVVYAARHGSQTASWTKVEPITVPALSSAEGTDHAGLDVDGYRFEVAAMNDPSYGPSSARPATTSSVPGVGVSFVWTRAGGGVTGGVSELWGTVTHLADLAQWSDVRAGTSGNRRGGLPSDAWRAGETTASAVVALRDVNGVHGVLVVFDLAASGSTFKVTRVRLTQWRGPLPAVTPTLGTGAGGIALGMDAADVQRILGTPATQTITHGQGGAEWHYANGLIVRLTGSSATPGSVWEIVAELPFDGATSEGARIGSSMDEVRRLFPSFTNEVTSPDQVQFRDEAGTQLNLVFDANGRVQLFVISTSP